MNARWESSLDTRQQGSETPQQPIDFAASPYHVPNFANGSFSALCEGLSTAPSPTFPYSYSPRRPSFLLDSTYQGPPSPPYVDPNSNASSASFSRPRSGSIGFLARPYHDILPHQPEAAARRDMFPNSNPSDSAPRMTPQVLPHPATFPFSPEPHRSNSATSTSPFMTSNLYNYSLSPYDTAQIFLPNKIPDEQLGTDQQTVEKPRAWSTGALDSISEGETAQLQSIHQAPNSWSPTRSSSLPDSDARSCPPLASRPSLPPLISLFPDLPKTSVANPVSPSTAWDDQVIHLGGDTSMFYKTSVKHLSEKMPSANSRHLTSELMPPPQTRPNRRCRPQNTDMKQATSIVDVSSYSPSPPRRQQFNMSSDHQHRIVASTGFEPVVEDSDAESEGHKNSGVCSDLERQHSYVELKDSAVAQRTQAQPQRTNFMEAVAASNSLSSTDRGSLPGVQVSSSPPRAAAPKPAIADMVTGSNPPQPVTFVHEQEESTCNHETRDYSSDISSLSDYSPCSSEDEESRRVADTKRPTTSSHHLSSSDHKNLYESEGEDVVVKSAHGKPLTRRSKVIITDTDRRRPGYIRPIEEDRRKVRSLLDSLLRSAPGNGRHLKSRFPYEPRTRSHHLGKMGLRLCWKEGAPFAEKELASSTRRFRKEQCERLIASIEGGYVSLCSLHNHAVPGSSPSLLTLDGAVGSGSSPIHTRKRPPKRVRGHDERKSEDDDDSALNTKRLCA